MGQIVPADLRDDHISKMADMICQGFSGRACVRHACQEWGYSQTLAGSMLQAARLQICNDWDMPRPTYAAIQLAQLETLQMQARRDGNLMAALGCIDKASGIARTKA
jgi:hypothetical protein